jgi:hypothetical protein
MTHWEGDEMPQPRIHASHAQRQAAYHKRCQEARKRQLEEKGLPAMPALPTVPGTARWNQCIANAKQLLHIAVEEMEAYFDERSEAWQDSEKADTFHERLDAVQEACDVLDALLTA